MNRCLPLRGIQRSSTLWISPRRWQRDCLSFRGLDLADTPFSWPLEKPFVVLTSRNHFRRRKLYLIRHQPSKLSVSCQQRFLFQVTCGFQVLLNNVLTDSIPDVCSAAEMGAQNVSWQIYVGFIASLIPFVIGASEFTKRIVKSLQSTDLFSVSWSKGDVQPVMEVDCLKRQALI